MAVSQPTFAEQNRPSTSCGVRWHDVAPNGEWINPRIRMTDCAWTESECRPSAFESFGLSYRRSRNPQGQWGTSIEIRPPAGRRLYRLASAGLPGIPGWRCQRTGEVAVAPTERYATTIVDDRPQPHDYRFCFLSERTSDGSRVAVEIMCHQEHARDTESWASPQIGAPEKTQGSPAAKSGI